MSAEETAWLMAHPKATHEDYLAMTNEAGQTTNVVNLDSPTANMFGIEPCPKCGSKYRWSPKRSDGLLIIRCDDCKLEEPVAEESRHLFHD